MLTDTINTTKQPQYLPEISDVLATTVAFFELKWVRKMRQLLPKRH